MFDPVVGAGSRMKAVITDVECALVNVYKWVRRLGQGQASPANRACPEHLYSGLTVVGKEAVVPAHCTV